MDSDFWTLTIAKWQFTLHDNHNHHYHSSQLDRLNIDNFEAEDEVRPEFPCLSYYEDFDISSLCLHLEDEHSCESKVAVCPICSIKVARDMLSHITLQHSFDPSLSYEQSEKRMRQAAGRSIFLQELLASSLLGD